mgnify:CR=1 FL=1
MKYPLILLCVYLLTACNNEPKPDTKFITYSGGDIITMSGPLLQYAEAVVIDGEEIVFVGSFALANLKYPDSPLWQLFQLLLSSFLGGRSIHLG